MYDKIHYNIKNKNFKKKIKKIKKYKIVFFDDAYIQSLYMEGSICLEVGTDHRETGFLNVSDKESWLELAMV